jgi:serine kinase of HPr protein (carbohydrate metabolism regulator)
VFIKKSAFVGEKNVDVIKMHGTTIKIIVMGVLVLKRLMFVYPSSY